MDVKELPVWPAAGVFPMLSDDELQELAADIKENGLREPIVVATADDEMFLVDGRNRRAACAIAEVEPEIRELNGEDLNAFVISANIPRRHLTKGQQAMAVAMVYPKGEKGGRGNKRDTNYPVSRQYVGHARTVLAYSKELAQGVLDGASPTPTPG